MKIAVIGLGYVGLPLAHAFSEKYEVVGFDIAQWRIDELSDGLDRTLELSEVQVKEAISHGMQFTNILGEIADCNIYVVTVPTPIDKHKKPDLTPLIKASESIGKVLKKDDIVIYESTVYPGATEEECVPVLKKFSGLKYISSETINQSRITNHESPETNGFYCGYSPERINPGDKEHTVTKILKVTAGSTPEIGQKVDDLYASIITAGTHLAPSIKVAEAAKVIENSQRDINIAFVNELAIIFNKLDIDTEAVLEAAGTKWNFLPFRPGLVGGHCIGVDPYYLTHKAQEVGYNPEIILAGRRLNDNMGMYVANQVLKLMIQKEHKIAGAKVLVLGITFKENCPDIRNSRVIDVIKELQEFGTDVSVYDPWADSEEVKREYGLDLLPSLDTKYDAVVLAVAHDKFDGLDIEKLKSGNDTVIYDIKSKLEESDGKL
ncbi:MAG: nucleotide sugar dehydrogenase [Campylobacterota bacterium]|nr:nucleotide sugar dehydrogenase [Campylobacterota bacterium]